MSKGGSVSAKPLLEDAMLTGALASLATTLEPSQDAPTVPPDQWNGARRYGPAGTGDSAPSTALGDIR
jgi:hypothetical protein